MILKAKTLFITGASRGIGLAIAKRAAADGANIVIAAKTTEPNPKLPGTIYTAATEIEAAGGRALPLAVDIREEGQAEVRFVEILTSYPKYGKNEITLQRYLGYHQEIQGLLAR